jgi:hypothetical protein
MIRWAQALQDAMIALGSVLLAIVAFVGLIYAVAFAIAMVKRIFR